MAENYIGTLLLVAVGLIVGLVMLSAISNDINTVTTTAAVNNRTYTAGAVGTPTEITGYQEVQGTYVLSNSSGATGAILVSNLTLASSVASGTKKLYLNTIDAKWAGKSINVTGTLEPYGYAGDSGSRAIVPLILIFSVIGLIVFALYPTIKSGISGVG